MGKDPFAKITQERLADPVDHDDLGTFQKAHRDGHHEIQGRCQLDDSAAQMMRRQTMVNGVSDDKGTGHGCESESNQNDECGDQAPLVFLHHSPDPSYDPACFSKIDAVLIFDRSLAPSGAASRGVHQGDTPSKSSCSESALVPSRAAAWARTS